MTGHLDGARGGEGLGAAGGEGHQMRRNLEGQASILKGATLRDWGGGAVSGGRSSRRRERERPPLQ